MTISNSTISVEEWRAALDTLTAPDDGGGWTTEELGEQWGVGAATARKRMRLLWKAGMLVRSGEKQIMRMNGKPLSVPAYKLKEKGKAGAL